MDFNDEQERSEFWDKVLLGTLICVGLVVGVFIFVLVNLS